MLGFRGTYLYRNVYVLQIVALMRHLSTNENWKTALVQCFKTSLSKAGGIASILQELKSSQEIPVPSELTEDISTLVATLTILGGHIERLRVGAMVLVEDINKPKATPGTVINYKLMNLKATILTSLRDCKTDEINVDHLIPVSKVFYGLNGSNIRQGKEHLKDLIPLTTEFYHWLLPLLGAPTEKKKKKGGEEQFAIQFDDPKKKEENKVVHFLILQFRALALEAINTLIEHSSPFTGSPPDYTGLLPSLFDIGNKSKLRNGLRPITLLEYAMCRRCDMVSFLPLSAHSYLDILLSTQNQQQKHLPLAFHLEYYEASISSG